MILPQGTRASFLIAHSRLGPPSPGNWSSSIVDETLRPSPTVCDPGRTCICRHIRALGCKDPEFRCGSLAPQNMAPRRKTKKKRRRVAARVQVPRVCAPALARLLSGGHRSELRLTLGEAVKGLWAHARAHGLQDGREIRCDDYMRRLFDCDRLGMFDIAGALSKHMTGAAAAAGSAAGTARSGSAASHTLVTLSPALTSLLCGSANGGGGGPRELTVSHGEALRLLGKYITRRGLRDATDRRKIHCDAALAECALPPAPPAAPPCPNAVIRRTVARATPLSHYSLSRARAPIPGARSAGAAGWLARARSRSSRPKNLSRATSLRLGRAAAVAAAPMTAAAAAPVPIEPAARP